MVRFGILGPIELSNGERRLPVGGPRQLRLLAFLVLHANRAVSSDRLIDALWSDQDPAGAAKRLQVAITRLRKALAGAVPAGEAGLRTVAGGYLLAVAPDELDSDVFRTRAEHGRRALEQGDVMHAAQLLREALALWRGPALAEVAYEEFAQAEIRRLEELRLTVLEARVDADLRLGRHAQLIGELQQLVSEQPWRERLHGQLMLALYRAGRQAEALEGYRHARQALVEQLGVEPASELRELERAILIQDRALDLEPINGAGAAEPITLGQRPAGAALSGRIPVPPTPTVGREADLVRLRELVLEPAVRLVTIVGPGGVGKTRLAVEAARAAERDFVDGAHFVSLAGLERSEDVASTIAREVGVTLLPSETVQDALIRHLHDRQMLVILDNFEHVLEAAPLVAELSARASALSILVTSREPLRLRAERQFRLDPLAVSVSDGDERAAPAVALFVAVARARDARRDFALSERSTRSVAEVCRRLDGLPLAIELAASRLGLLSIAELADHVRDGLEGLGPASRDAPARQRTLTATLEWSYNLLTSQEKATLLDLTVFAGGCTLIAAQTVTGATFEVLEALVDKNLVVAAQDDDGPSRLTLLETVREFALARLRQQSHAGEVCRRHCEHFLAFAERSASVLRRSHAPAVVTTLDRELDNMRAALNWALERPAPVLALRLATALRPYWDLRGLDGEAASWLEAALGVASDAVPASVRAAALDAYADSLAYADTSKRAEAAAREALELRGSLGEISGCAESLRTVAMVMLSMHRIEEAYRSATEAERLARQAGDDRIRVEALNVMAHTAPSLEETLALERQASNLYRAGGELRRLANLKSSVTYAVLCRGEHAAAQRLVVEALDAAKTIDDPVVTAFVNGNLGLIAILRDEVERAAHAFATELRLANQIPFPRLQFESLNGLAAVAAAQNQDELAAQLCGAADATCGDRHDPSIADQLDTRFFTPAHTRLGDQSWQAARAAGTELRPRQALDIAQQAFGNQIAR